MRKKDDEVHKRQIANRLKSVRNNLNMTQEQFAEVLEISVSAYKKVESGENQVSIECLTKLNRKLRISSDYILFGLHKPLEESWRILLNSTDVDKMTVLLRLIRYFTKTRDEHYLSEQAQAQEDKEIVKILEAMNL